MNTDSLFFSIVVPVYNEEDAITPSIRKIEGYLAQKNIKYEIILVDDGSVDNTKEKIKYAIVGNPKIKLLENATNEGKGSAVRKGTLNSRGDYIIFMDADLSTPVEEISKIMDSLDIDKEAIFIGTRDEKERSTKVVRPAVRKLISSVYNFVVNLLFNLDIKDVGCGFKCFSSKIAKEIFKRQYIKGWVFDVEVLLRVRIRDIRIKEIPVSWTSHLPTRLNIIPDSIYCSFDLTKLLFYYLFKKI